MAAGVANRLFDVSDLVALLIESESKSCIAARIRLEATLMPEWLERAVNVFVGALVLVLLVKYRDKGILRRIGESKYRFRRWLRASIKTPDGSR
jgi:hypothetical protein